MISISAVGRRIYVTQNDVKLLNFLVPTSGTRRLISFSNGVLVACAEDGRDSEEAKFVVLSGKDYKLVYLEKDGPNSVHRFRDAILSVENCDWVTVGTQSKVLNYVQKDYT